MLILDNEATERMFFKKKKIKRPQETANWCVKLQIFSFYRVLFKLASVTSLNLVLWREELPCSFSPSEFKFYNDNSSWTRKQTLFFLSCPGFFAANSICLISFNNIQTFIVCLATIWWVKPQNLWRRLATLNVSGTWLSNRGLMSFWIRTPPGV